MLKLGRDATLCKKAFPHAQSFWHATGCLANTALAETLADLPSDTRQVRSAKLITAFEQACSRREVEDEVSASLAL